MGSFELNLECSDDDSLHLSDSDVEEKKDGFNMTIINTNVRSICPKIDSVVETFEELDAVFGIFTETWLSDGPELVDKLDDLREGAGLGAIVKNRDVNPMGFSHGGVALLYRESQCTFKEVTLPNPGNFEVLVAAARFPGHSAQVIVVGCYLPPTYNTARATAALEYIRDVVTRRPAGF